MKFEDTIFAHKIDSYFVLDEPNKIVKLEANTMT